jgi:hypothetical protein
MNETDFKTAWEQVVTPETRMWRTLLCVEKVDENNVWLRVPAWNSEKEIKVSRSIFPPILNEKFKPEFYFFGKANIGCDEAEQMRFADFEVDDL